MTALFLSILFPGLGHFYYGKNRKGLVLAGISFIPFVYPFALIYSLYDINKLIKNKEVPELSKMEAVTIIVASIAMPMVFVLTVFFAVPELYVSALGYIENTSYAELNKTTMIDISSALEGYYRNHNTYPGNLQKIIGDNPMRKKWKQDPWGNLYIYEPDKGRSSYILISKGKDGVSNTEDDVLVRSEDHDLRFRLKPLTLSQSEI